MLPSTNGAFKQTKNLNYSPQTDMDEAATTIGDTVKPYVNVTIIAQITTYYRCPMKDAKPAIILSTRHFNNNAEKGLKTDSNNPQVQKTDEKK